MWTLEFEYFNEKVEFMFEIKKRNNHLISISYYFIKLNVKFFLKSKMQQKISE